MSHEEPDASFGGLPPHSDGAHSTTSSSVGTSRRLRTSQTPMSHDTMSRMGHSDRSSSMMPTSPMRGPDFDAMINDLDDRNSYRSGAGAEKDRFFGFGDTSGYLFEGAADDLAALKQAWISERMAPELLRFERALVDRVMERIRKQIEYIEVNSMDLTRGSDTKLKLLLVETDLERIKFIMRGYLRARLAKIDKYTMHLINDDLQRSKLSEEEIEYMMAHNQILTRLYRIQFLGRIPEQLRALDDLNDVPMIETPDLNRTVFVRVVEDILEPVVIGTQRLLLDNGGIYALRYSAVASLVDQKAVVLI